VDPAQNLKISASAMRKTFTTLVLLFLFAGCNDSRTTDAAARSGRADLNRLKIGDSMVAFGGPRLSAQHQNVNIDYALTPDRERFFVHVPQAFSDDGTYGLVIFIHSGDEVGGLPTGWKQVLDSRKYLFVAPQNAGNDHPANRRLGLAVLGALEMLGRYRIDRNRVYAAGFSGGARIAGLLGFYESDIFRGTIQNCGADFYRSVPRDAATSELSTSGSLYGVLAEPASSDDITAAKQVHFALITGTNDFRRGNILDIYNGGFKHEGFHAKLFDVAGMDHDIADGKTLSSVLDYLEGSDTDLHAGLTMP
jgi:hypothetical protein